MSPRSKTIPTNVVVALLGLLGVIITAIMSLLANILPVRMSTQATQTAEKITLPTSSPNSFTPPLENIDIGVKKGWTSCGIPRVLPDYIQPEKDTTLAFDQILQAINNNEVVYWSRVTSDVNSTFDVTLTNILQTNNWLELDNTIHVDISATGVPEHLNLVRIGWGCGGEGEIRYFEPIILKADSSQFGSETVFSEADFFSLQPGEFEKFSFPFRCASPGTYYTNFSIPYSYLDQSKTANFAPETEIVCPKSFTLWEITGHPLAGQYAGLVKVADFTWNSTNYAAVGDLTGNWENESSNFMLHLLQNWEYLEGGHLSISQDKIDSDEDSISGTIQGDVATISFYSSFAQGYGTAQIKFIDENTIFWKITVPPNGEYLLPNESILTKNND